MCYARGGGSCYSTLQVSWASESLSQGPRASLVGVLPPDFVVAGNLIQVDRYEGCLHHGP